MKHIREGMSQLGLGFKEKLQNKPILMNRLHLYCSYKRFKIRIQKAVNLYDLFATVAKSLTKNGDNDMKKIIMR